MASPYNHISLPSETKDNPLETIEEKEQEVKMKSKSSYRSKNIFKEKSYFRLIFASTLALISSGIVNNILLSMFAYPFELEVIDKNIMSTTISYPIHALILAIAAILAVFILRAVFESILKIQEEGFFWHYGAALAITAFSSILLLFLFNIFINFPININFLLAVIISFLLYPLVFLTLQNSTKSKLILLTLLIPIAYILFALLDPSTYSESVLVGDLDLKQYNIE